MKKLEPGMLCRVVGSLAPENNGKIVTLIAFVSIPPIHMLEESADAWGGNDWWEVDRDMVSITYITEIKSHSPYIRGCRLQSINPDHKPADEEWQAGFKRLLSRNPARQPS